jgi:hypothetical protein
MFITGFLYRRNLYLLINQIMRRKLLITVTILFIGLNSLVYSQQYVGSLGLRLGTPIGGVAKYFVSEWIAVEGIFASSWDGFSTTLLFEKHYLVKRRTPLFGYYGIGGHVGFWDGNAPWVDGNVKQMIYGVDVIVGMEYLMEEAPISVSVDWMPAIHINAVKKLYLTQIGVSVRYYLW